jgi:putative addiction module killer protein
MTMEIKQTETFRTWETKLKDRRARTIIATHIIRMAEGLAGDVASVGDGVQELRIHHGPGYRLYFQQRGSMMIVFLCGGNKGSQKRDIVLAKKLAQAWNETHG